MCKANWISNHGSFLILVAFLYVWRYLYSIWNQILWWLYKFLFNIQFEGSGSLIKCDGTTHAQAMAKQALRQKITSDSEVMAFYETFLLEDKSSSVVLDDLKASEQVRIVLNNRKRSKPVLFFFFSIYLFTYHLCIIMSTCMFISLLISADVPIFTYISSCCCCKLVLWLQILLWMPFNHRCCVLVLCLLVIR